MHTNEPYKAGKAKNISGTRSAGRIEHHQLMHMNNHRDSDAQNLKVCECVFWLSSRWQSCMYAFVCIVYVNVPVSVCVCICMRACVCIGCQMWRAGRGRGYMVRGGVYLFITQRPPRFQGDMATLVLAPLALVCLWPALALPKPSALTFCALSSCLFLLPFFFFPSVFRSCFNFHLCFSHNVLCWLSFFSALGKILYVTRNPPGKTATCF